MRCAVPAEPLVFKICKLQVGYAEGVANGITLSLIRSCFIESCR